MPHMDLPLLKHLNLSYNYIHTIQQQDVSSLHHLATLQLIRCETILTFFSFF